jgi:hypothetical protein
MEPKEQNPSIKLNVLSYVIRGKSKNKKYYWTGRCWSDQKTDAQKSRSRQHIVETLDELKKADAHFHWELGKRLNLAIVRCDGWEE